MKNLEQKIIKEVYYLETRQTLSQLFFRLTLMIGLTITGILLIVFTIAELGQLQTLDLFEIFSEDFGVIKENIGEVVDVVLIEAPAWEILFAVTSLVLFLILVLKFIGNFSRIKNKINSLIKFWIPK